MNIGDMITVTAEEAKALRKQGYMPRSDLVTMMYVGIPNAAVPSNRSIASAKGGEATRRNMGWSKKDHEFVARKLAEANA